MKKVIIGTILLNISVLLLLNPCVAQDSVKESRFAFNGYVKDMQMVIFQDVKDEWMTANLIHNRLNFKWFISPSLTGSIELRNRFLYGDMLQRYPGYNKTFEEDNGMANLSKNLCDEKSFLLNSSIDRLWIDYSKNKFQLTIGRQRINWGQTFVWNPNDIFNSHSYFDFDYEEKAGSDAVRMQYYLNSTSVIEVAAKSTGLDKQTIAGLYRFNRWKYDVQLLGGIVDNSDYVLGAGWSGEILKGGFRGEASYFHPQKKFTDTTGVFTASVGYDYTFKNSLFLQVEALYNGSKESLEISSLSRLNRSSLNVKNLFLTDWSFFLSTAYPATPLINVSMSGIINPKHKLYFLIPSLSVSLKDNLELSMIAQLQQYLEPSSIKRNTSFIFLRVKHSF